MDTDFGNFEIDYSVPSEVSYDVSLLKRFCEKDPNVSLIFYGGEPTLRTELMKKIMNEVEAKYFVIQTNGLHLNELDAAHLNRLHTIFVSIDGDEELTDYYRGRGVYRRVIENVKLARKRGFRGEITARMTVMEETDIYDQVMWLLNNPDFKFSSVHWQIDAGFWKNDFKKRPFAKWVEKNYNPGIRRLVKHWIRHMEEKGEVLRIYPFISVAQSLLRGEKSLLRCGSGWANYTIQTDGHIIPCPAMNGMKDYYLGHLRDAHPLGLKKVYVGEPCTRCPIFHECGGRCLYANITKRWDENQYSLVCRTVRNLIDSLKAILPRVRKLIREGRIRETDFDYVKYNGCEAIP